MTKHSEGKKHRDRVKPDDFVQQTIAGFVGQFSVEALEEKRVVEAARMFEIALARAFSMHQMSPMHLGCFVDIMKKFLPDSEIMKKVSLSETKGSYSILYC